jgi:hypothetical protein
MTCPLHDVGVFFSLHLIVSYVRVPQYLTSLPLRHVIPVVYSLYFGHLFVIVSPCLSVGTSTCLYNKLTVLFHAKHCTLSP